MLEVERRMVGEEHQSAEDEHRMPEEEHHRVGEGHRMVEEVRHMVGGDMREEERSKRAEEVAHSILVEVHRQAVGPVVFDPTSIRSPFHASSRISS